MKTHAAPLRHADGTTVHLAITHDIAERKRAERTSLLLSAIVDSSDDAIISKLARCLDRGRDVSPALEISLQSFFAQEHN